MVGFPVFTGIVKPYQPPYLEPFRALACWWWDVKEVTMLFRFLAPLRAHTDTALVALLGPLSLCLPLWAHPAPVCPPPRAAACCDCSLQAMSRRRLATCRLWSGCQRATSPPPCPRRWAWRGEHRWTGVPLRHLVELLGGGERSRIVLTALNDYAVEIPWSDLLRYNPCWPTGATASEWAFATRGR